MDAGEKSPEKGLAAERTGDGSERIDGSECIEGSGRIRWLAPSEVRLFRDAGGHVRATVAGYASVLRPALHRAFPITAGHLYIQLREQDGEAVGMLKDLSKLDRESRTLAGEILRERYVVPLIREIRSLSHEIGMWAWDVETDRGDREFGIKSTRDDIRRLAGGRVRITDVHGNTYEISDVAALDAHSRALFDRIG